VLVHGFVVLLLTSLDAAAVVSWILTMWMSGSFLIFALGRVLGADITFSQGCPSMLTALCAMLQLGF